MLSVHVIKARDTVALSQYYEGMAAEDYYEHGGEPPGYWAGGGAAVLGLESLVKEGELLQGMLGFHPRMRTQLAQNAGANHKPGWDCTLSAPKSVSAVWAVASPTMRWKIQEAQREAVAAGLDYLQREAFFTRHGHGGAESHILDKGLAFACYEHSTSRNQDPQVHTHCIAFNLTPEGRGVDFNYAHVHAAGALYRAELAWQLRGLGFAIEKDTGGSFKLTGAPEKLIDQWSSRRKEILEKAAEHGVTTARGMEVATFESRGVKQGVDRPALLYKWSQEAQEYGFTAEHINELSVSGHGGVPETAKTIKAVYVAEVDMRSTVSRPQVLRAVAIEYVGHASAMTIESHTQEILNSDLAIRLHSERNPEQEYLKSGVRYTTRAQIEMERELISLAKTLVNRSIYRIDNLGRRYDRLTEAQRQAVRHLTEGQDLSLLQGWAGAGKTHTLAAALEDWESQGFRVVGVSLSNLAARNLQQEAHIASRSLAKLTQDLDKGQDVLDNRTVVVVDEASMLSTRQMLNLVQCCETAKSKLVLVGDYKQLQAIESGAPFRALCERIGFAELSEVRRQLDPREREMARAFREGRALDGLTYLHQQERLHIDQNLDQAAERLAAAYMDDRQAGWRVLAVAGTRAEVRLLNNSIREEMRERALLPSEDQDCEVHVSTGWRRICPDEEILFLKSHDFQDQGGERIRVINGDHGKVLDLTADAEGLAHIHVALERGHEIMLDTVDFDKLDYAYAITVHKSQGQTIDYAHVLAGDMAHREWGYVAMSRHRESVTVYSTEARMDAESFIPGHEVQADEQKLVRDLEWSQQKDMAIDYYLEIEP